LASIPPELAHVGAYRDTPLPYRFKIILKHWKELGNGSSNSQETSVQNPGTAWLSSRPVLNSATV
jgi:hypothetical protein